MSALQIFFLVLGAGLILFWLFFALFGPRPLDRTNVLAVLRYGMVLRTFALIVALTPPFIMMYVIWGYFWRDQATLASAGGSFLGLSFLTGWLCFEAIGLQVVLTEEGISRFYPWGRGITLRWQEINSIRYSSLNQWFILTGAGRKIRLSRHLTDLRLFAETMRRKLAAERYAGAAKVFDKIR